MLSIINVLDFSKGFFPSLVWRCSKVIIAQGKQHPISVRLRQCLQDKSSPHLAFRKCWRGEADPFLHQCTTNRALEEHSLQGGSQSALIRAHLTNVENGISQTFSEVELSQGFC